MKRATPILAAVLICLPSQSFADTRGFSIGLGAHSSHVGGDGGSGSASAQRVDVDQVGRGATLVLGYGVTPSFAVRIGISGARHETSELGVDVEFSSGTFEGAYFFRAGQPLRPYLFGGVGGFSLRSRQDAFDYETSGPGAVIGAGLLYFLGEHFALDFAARGDFINWAKNAAESRIKGSDTRVETSIEKEGRAAKILFGIGWWF